jgi:hypothetical protein
MMNYTLQLLVTTIEEIKEELYAIYLRKQNKMSAELKQSVKLIQDIRLRFGMINTNQTNWGCADCIYTVLGHSIIPFIESRRYEEIKESLVPVDDKPGLLDSDVAAPIILEKEVVVESTKTEGVIKKRRTPKN